MDCVFEEFEPGKFRCTADDCDHEYIGKAGLRWNCKSRPEERLLAEIAAYPLAVSREEVDRRLAVCRSCPEFTGDNCHKLNTCCAHSRDWFWALTGLQDSQGGAKIGPCGKWKNGVEPSRASGGNFRPLLFFDV